MLLGEKRLIRNWQANRIWSTETVPKNRQFNHWCDFVNQAHLTWNIAQQSYDNFPAFIREGRLDGISVVNLTAAEKNIQGVRGNKEIGRDDVSLFNVLYIKKGSECLVFNDREVVLNAGEFMLWDSTRPMNFTTGANLHQVTLCVTHERLLASFPNAEAFVGRSMKTSHGLNRLFIEHILSLDEQFGDLLLNQAQAVLDATVEMLAITLGSQQAPSATRASAGLFEGICRHIEENLQDSELSISSIAREHRISIRKVHRLFGERNLSAARFILRRRLEKCKSELGAPGLRHISITDIAFRWGVLESSTFSKAFRREFGIAPREYRKAMF